MLELKISLFHYGQSVATLKTSDGTMVEGKVNSFSLELALKNLRNCLHAVGYKDESDEILTVDDAIREFEKDYDDEQKEEIKKARLSQVGLSKNNL